MSDPVTLTVNGKKETVTVDPDTPLLFVLRNELKLTGPKMGCGMAQCSACAVLLDGEEIRACVTPVSHAVGGAIFDATGVWPRKLPFNAAILSALLQPKAAKA